jgi:hypothetical protein
MSGSDKIIVDHIFSEHVLQEVKTYVYFRLTNSLSVPNINSVRDSR